jgi:hypothetical protein
MGGKAETTPCLDFAIDCLARRNIMRDLVADLGREAEKGEFVSEAALTRWFHALGTASELPESVADLFVKPAGG